MTEHHDTHRPPACHYDRAIGQRVTREHRDDCPRGHDCPGERGCAPCTAPHCLVCGRNHSTNSEPQTCPKCIGLIVDDCRELAACYADLATEALEAGSGGQLAAAAPIPGGTAQVLIGPTVRLDILRVSREMSKTHRPTDPLPALAVLAQWEDMYRTWLDHTPARQAVTITRPGGTAQMRVPARATIAGACRYLAEQVPYLANHMTAGGPDFLAFVDQVRKLRADAERVLHDEDEPERGVDCFECGGQLERRFRRATRCRHETPAREALQQWVDRRDTAQAWLRTLATYDLYARQDELVAAAAPPARLIAEARRPCEECAAGGSGGIDDPTPGRSWECPGCRKQYDPGEYALAMRRSLLDGDADGQGWCTLPTAAAAAAQMSGRPITAATIRTWIARKDNIGICCWWATKDVDGVLVGKKYGVQLVFWPDVADRLAETRTRGRKAAS